ncbi:MAG: hypothetical protein ACREDW_07725, partial [Aestuariivirgaceae bacterium]
MAPVYQIIATIAFPLIYAVYVGVAEGARDIAVALAGKRRPDSHVTRSSVGWKRRCEAPSSPMSRCLPP